MPSLKRFDGEMQVDNRAAGEGQFGLPTLACRHCGGVWLVNPDRTRAREYCRTCDKYICDTCAAVAKKPGYVHRTIDELTEMVTSGRHIITGGSVCEPILTRAR